MCGIAGLTSVDRVSPGEVQAVREITRCMSSRGPDAEGVWTGDHVALGHRRLAILDLDTRSNQPMHLRGERYSVVFNGEIYNFRQLREDLEREGEVFRTTSDTEILLALYARLGEKMLPMLRGMFAFAIWDAKERELFLARDPYGIKPLYYARIKGGLVFASQVKALLAGGVVTPSIEPAALAGFYLWGSVPEPWTVYRGVMALPAGTWMKVRAGVAKEPVCWHDIAEAWRHEQLRYPAGELDERVRKATTDSVQAHLVSDVPVSVFLSGGIDSGAITGLAFQLGAKVEAVTIGFDEFADQDNDEVPFAAAIASQYDVDHYVRRVTRNEFERDLPRFLECMDQPTVDGLNTWFASKAAAERGYKVALSGVGGDELFYGYSLASEIPRSVRRHQRIVHVPGVRPLLQTLVRAVPPGRFHPKFKGVPDWMGTVAGEYFLRRGLFLPQELPVLMGEEQAREGLERLGGRPPGVRDKRAVNPDGEVCMLDSTMYLRNQLLRDSDWASMAHSLELRTPLVDSALLASFRSVHAQFANGTGKRLLAHAPAESLPGTVIRRPKCGFSIPMTQWMADAAGWANGSRSSPVLPPRSPWTRRWAMYVMDSYLKPAGEVRMQMEA